MRAHFNRAIVDPEGNLIPFCLVRIIDPLDGVTNITQTIYPGDSTTTALTNPFVTSSGIVDFYLDTAERVRLGITRPDAGSVEYYIEDMDVYAPISTLG